MDFIISFLLSTRLFAFMAGAGGTDVAFDQPQIIVSDGHIIMSCRLERAYSPELRQLARSATPIPLYLFAELEDDRRNYPVVKVTLESILFYDIISKQYRVTRNTRQDTAAYANLDSAINDGCSFDHFLLSSTDSLRKEGNYHIVAYAVLGKTNVEALGNKPVDLMYYWNYKRPSIKTETIEGSVFIKK